MLSSTGWRRRGFAALLGLLATLALPPFYLLPFLIPAFAGLYLLVNRAPSRRQAFLDGWWWGLGHFTTGLYWICISLWVDPEHFAWMTPFALFGLPAVLGIYTGLATWLFYLIGGRQSRENENTPPCLILPPAKGGNRVSPSYHILLFAALWVGVEFLRAHLFTGFPWNLIGYAWGVSDATRQLASVTGIYGLSWLAVFFATMPALFMTEPEQAGRMNVRAALLLALVAGFGAWRLEAHPTRYTDVKVRIVQGNIAQALKWEPKTVLDGLRRYARLTRSPGIESVKLVLWPETAVPYYVEPDSGLTQELGTLLPPGALLLTGGMRNGGYHPTRAWNSLFAIDAKGRVVAGYDKHHLVPFGEYIPLRPFLPAWLESVANGMGDFSRGPGPRTLAIASYPPFSPLVCYEAIFPDEATDGQGKAQWIFNFTNDAWFGLSTGPLQHLEMARMRAVEQGLPLLRAANTGISAGFDAMGRELAALPLEKEGVLDLYLPTEEAEQSIAHRYPESGLLFMLASSVVFIRFGRHKRAVFL